MHKMWQGRWSHTRCAEVKRVTSESSRNLLAMNVKEVEKQEEMICCEVKRANIYMSRHEGEHM